MASEKAKEAWKRILESIEEPEKFDDDISILTEELNVETDDGYEARYNDLREKYRKRFGEMVERINTKDPEPETETEYVTESFNDLDFDGSTE